MSNNVLVNLHVLVFCRVVEPFQDNSDEHVDEDEGDQHDKRDKEHGRGGVRPAAIGLATRLLYLLEGLYCLAALELDGVLRGQAPHELIEGLSSRTAQQCQHGIGPVLEVGVHGDGIPEAHMAEKMSHIPD